MGAVAKMRRRHWVGGKHLSGISRDAEAILPKAGAGYEIHCCG
jgi:hypothetical protein